MSQGLNGLGPDNLLLVASFVADVPFEFSTESSGSSSTLTHVLPLISRQFHSIFCNSIQSDFLWRNALERLARNEPALWKEALSELVCSTSFASSDDQTRDFDREKQESHEGLLVQSALHSYFGVSGNNQEHPIPSTHPHKQLFKHILFSRMRYTYPAFYSVGTSSLGRAFKIHFYEPRYRIMISEVMEPFFSHAFKNGQPMKPELLEKKDNNNTNEYQRNRTPKFIYANNNSLERNTPACIVEITQCTMHPNGTADVIIKPVEHVRLEKVWTRPNSPGLIEAQVIRMNSVESQHVEYINYRHVLHQEELLMKDANYNLDECYDSDFDSEYEHDVYDDILDYLSKSRCELYSS
mmetsp:Transcript_7101/g.10177  ORF Transcript_7101/g.10177 Transcript_7101/m.10177 type:complete len:353 (+) Transcript_7101:61-1119(+)